MKSLDLKPEHFQRRPKAPAVVKPREIKGVQGVRGTMPLRAGEVVLTPDEANRLRAMGWQPGDPIPGDLPEHIKAQMNVEKKLINSEIRNTMAVPPDTPRTKIAEPIDINDLDATKRAEIEGYLAEFKKVAPQIENAIKAREKMSKATPSVQKAIVAAEREGIELVDSRKEKEAVGKSLYGEDFVTVEDIQRKIDIVEGRVPNDGIKDIDELDDEEELVATPDQGKDAIVIDYTDKVNYVVAIMSGKPFRKLYNLLGGRLQITFKQPSTMQSEMVMTQIVQSSRSGLTDQAENLRAGYSYRTLLSLDSISLDGSIWEFSDYVNDYIDENIDKILPTPLPQLVKNMCNIAPFTSETVWHLCHEYSRKFAELIDKLESKADDPNFWDGIEA